MIYLIIEDVSIATEQIILDSLSNITCNKLMVDIYDVRYEHDQLGKPVVYINNAEILKCSIAHKDIIKVMALSNSEIGIDIESKQIKSHLTYLFHRNEQQLLAINSSLNLTKLWTLKEAASKSLGFGLNYGINSIYISNIKEDTIYFNNSVTDILYVAQYLSVQILEYTISLIYNVQRSQ